MKILQINAVYKFGSTGKIVYELHKQIENSSHESFIIYGRGKSVNENNVYKTSPDWDGKLQALFARITGDFYGGAFYSTYKLLKRIKRISPDIVHIHLMNGNYVNNYKLLNFLAKNNYKTVITLHAEINYTGLCEHAFNCERWKIGCGKCPQVFEKYKSLFTDRTALEWKRKAKAFATFTSLTLVSVSSWLDNRAKQSPMFLNRNFFVVGNGIDTEIYKPVNSNNLKLKFGFKDQKIILHVTPSFTSSVKGGEYVIELAKRLKNDNVVIIIVGFNGNQIDLPSNIIAISHTNSQQELAQFYSLANFTLLTSKLETFSMVCAESLSCGTPVVGFKAGAPEQIAVKEYSEFVENGDVNALEVVARKWLNKSINSQDVIDKVNNKYSKETMYSNYLHIYEGLI
ncbi:glycosyltransferase [Flavobacterium sp.]|jgi:putative colanic acid biosynthesis glycosyltransferase|uniref:glycosyltransferase n=1 Tax=Flavobacterium sp. TaxID=239 RepID=UPI0037C059EA